MVDNFIFDLRFLGFSNQLNVLTNLKFICKVSIDSFFESIEKNRGAT